MSSSYYLRVSGLLFFFQKLTRLIPSSFSRDGDDSRPPLPLDQEAQRPDGDNYRHLRSASAKAQELDDRRRVVRSRLATLRVGLSLAPRPP